MAFLVATSKCKCENVMGMPMDVGECLVAGCEAKKSCWGERSLSQLEDWAVEHAESHTAEQRREVKEQWTLERERRLNAAHPEQGDEQ